jgi:hypothetical protein
MEREKGFEPPAAPVISRTYGTSEGDGQSPTEPADASGRIARALHDGDDQGTLSPLPAPSAELFIVAGAIVAARAAEDGQEPSEVEQFLRRAVDQASALTRSPRSRVTEGA